MIVGKRKLRLGYKKGPNRNNTKAKQDGQQLSISHTKECYCTSYWKFRI